MLHEPCQFRVSQPHLGLITAIPQVNPTVDRSNPDARPKEDEGPSAECDDEAWKERTTAHVSEQEMIVAGKAARSKALPIEDPLEILGSCDEESSECDESDLEEWAMHPRKGQLWT